MNISYLLFDEVRLFCKVFCNLKQFRYNISEWKHLLSLLYNLPSLSMIQIVVARSEDVGNFVRWFEEQSFQSGMIYQVEEMSISNVYK